MVLSRAVTAVYCLVLDKHDNIKWVDATMPKHPRNENSCYRLTFASASLRQGCPPQLPRHAHYLHNVHTWRLGFTVEYAKVAASEVSPVRVTTGAWKVARPAGVRRLPPSTRPGEDVAWGLRARLGCDSRRVSSTIGEKAKYLARRQASSGSARHYK